MNKCDQLMAADLSLYGWDRRSYLARMGDAVSQFFNVWLLNGMPDETISGRSYRIDVLDPRPTPWRWRMIRKAAELLFFWEGGHHTKTAFWDDLFRARARFHAAELFAMQAKHAQRKLASSKKMLPERDGGQQSKL